MGAWRVGSMRVTNSNLKYCLQITQLLNKIQIIISLLWTKNTTATLRIQESSKIIYPYFSHNFWFVESHRVCQHPRIQIEKVALFGRQQKSFDYCKEAEGNQPLIYFYQLSISSSRYSHYMIQISNISHQFIRMGKDADFQMSPQQFKKMIEEPQTSKEKLQQILKKVSVSNRPLFNQYISLLTKSMIDIMSFNLQHLPILQYLYQYGTCYSVKLIDQAIQSKIKEHCNQNPIYSCIRNSNESDAYLVLKYLTTAHQQLLIWEIKESLVSYCRKFKKYSCLALIITKLISNNIGMKNQEIQNIEGIVENQCVEDYQVKEQLAEILKLMRNHHPSQKHDIENNGQAKESPDIQNQKTELLRKSSLDEELDDGSICRQYSDSGINRRSKTFDNLDHGFEENPNDRKIESLLSEHHNNKPLKSKSSGVLSLYELKQYLQLDIEYQVQEINRRVLLDKENLNQFLRLIIDEIKSQYDVNVQIYGSIATGLCLPDSDADLLIVSKNSTEIYSEIILETVYQRLQSKNQISLIKFIKATTVPIIKIQGSSSFNSRKIDITYYNKYHYGRQAINLIKQYLKIYPPLKSLILIIKQIVHAANLSDPYLGGFSSYTIIFMAIAHIQQIVRTKIQSKMDVSIMAGQLLVSFLKFYSIQFTYIGKIITILEPQDAEEQLKGHINPNNHIFGTNIYSDNLYGNDGRLQQKLIIIDPFNQSNNIGRTSYKIQELRNVFQLCYVSLYTNKRCHNKRYCESYLNIKKQTKMNSKFEKNKKPCCLIKRLLQICHRQATQFQQKEFRAEF